MIAVNYPARKFGIGRHCTVTEAKKLCPDLICQHVATWREGDEKFAYHEDAAANIATHKVSLDPYRLESRKILALIKDSLPPGLQMIERASIDEVFLNLSAHVHSLLLERYPELGNPPPSTDPSSKLPLPHSSSLDWQADALVDLDKADDELNQTDWDDVAMLIGSEIVRGVRARVRQELKYTCSAGIANNKMLSKLGSGFKKPNQQTVIRNRAVQHFLSEFKVTKIRNLGGKLGDLVVSTFNTDVIHELLPVTLDQFKSKLEDDTAVWLYNTIRGVDLSEVNPRTQIKSMLSAKSFRPFIKTREQADRWLRIFVADIYSRLVEEGVVENKRRPKTINLHSRHAAQTRSRQGPIPQGKVLDEKILFGLAKSLLDQIIQEGTIWPCSNLSLSVSGFEDAITGNMAIGSFLVRGEEAQALQAGLGPKKEAGEAGIGDHVDKRRRVETGGIARFFGKKEAAREVTGGGQSSDELSTELGGEAHDEDQDKEEDSAGTAEYPFTDRSRIAKSGAGYHQSPVSQYLCSSCAAEFETAEALQDHNDWHLAKELQEAEDERVKPTFAKKHAVSHNKVNSSGSNNTASGGGGASSRKRAAAPTSSSNSKRTSSGKVESGQTKLTFG